MSEVLSKENKERRVSSDDAAFVLQSWNWKETSLLVEFSLCTMAKWWPWLAELNDRAVIFEDSLHRFPP